MVTINAFIALTALGCITFLAMAVRGSRRNATPRLDPPTAQLRKAA